MNVFKVIWERFRCRVLPHKYIYKPFLPDEDVGICVYCGHLEWIPEGSIKEYTWGKWVNKHPVD